MFTYLLDNRFLVTNLSSGHLKSLNKLYFIVKDIFVILLLLLVSSLGVLSSKLQGCLLEVFLFPFPLLIPSSLDKNME